MLPLSFLRAHGSLIAITRLVFILLRGHAARDRVLQERRQAEGTDTSGKTLGGVLHD